MKKFIAILALVSVMLCSVACSTMPKDAKTAKKNLKAEDCTVEVSDDSDDIEYYTEIFNGDSDGIEEILYAVDEDEIDDLMMFFCEDTKTASALYDDLLEFFEEDFEDVADPDIDIDEYYIVKSGTVVALGHEDLIEAAKG